MCNDLLLRNTIHAVNRRATLAADAGSVRRLSALLLVVTITGLATPAHAETVDAESTGLVLINELSNGGVNSDADTFFELRNWDDHAIDLSGWQVFRCSAQGLRSNVSRTEGDLTGIVLEPGAIVTVSRIGLAGDLHTSSPYDTSGFGLYLEAPDDSLADRVGVYPNEPWPTQSECSGSRNLPNSLNFATGESWQRVGTGPLDFVAAPATLGEQNATAAPARAATTVIITEFAASLPVRRQMRRTLRRLQYRLEHLEKLNARSPADHAG